MASNASLPNLLVSTIDTAPYISRDVTSDNKEVYVGFLKDLLDEIAKIARFNYEFVQPDREIMGREGAQGWEGVVGDVVNKKADIGAAALTVTHDREMAVDFTKPYMSNSISLLVKKPFWFDLGLGYLVKPLSGDFWIMLLVVLLLIGIAFFIIGKFSPYEWGNVAAEKDPRGAKNSFTLRNSYLFALSTLTWQGFREAPKSLSGRILAAFWWMFVLFTLVAYTANLTAYFLARPDEVPDLKFKTYEDLLQSSDIHSGALHFGATQEMLRTSRRPTLRGLWSKMSAQNSWESSYAGALERVKSSDGTYVFFMETNTAEYYARQNCKLMIFGETLFPTNMAFAVQKGSVWRNKFDAALLELKTNGIVDELRKRYWKFGGKCSNVDGRTMKGGELSSLPVYPVSLKDMAVAILLLFLGFIVSIVFLIIEVIHYAVTKQGKKIEKPKLPKMQLPKRPQIFKGKGKSKAAPAGVEAPPDEEAGPSSDGLESVALVDEDEALVSASDEIHDEIHVEDEAEQKAEV